MYNIENDQNSLLRQVRYFDDEKFDYGWGFVRTIGNICICTVLNSQYEIGWKNQTKAENNKGDLTECLIIIKSKIIYIFNTK